tara:strand:+ start:355 stop:693 length:339 start_codon:yes stop_codon:yes gene_type:complete
MALYKQDSNDSTKQDPVTRNGKAFYSHATCPTAETLVKRPTYIVVNNRNSGGYFFAYDSASAALDTGTTNYITGSILDADAGPVKIDISPVAWRAGTGSKTGDVTFVYVRVN